MKDESAGPHVSLELSIIGALVDAKLALACLSHVLAARTSNQVSGNIDDGLVAGGKILFGAATALLPGFDAAAVRMTAEAVDAHHPCAECRSLYRLRAIWQKTLHILPALRSPLSLQCPGLPP